MISQIKRRARRNRFAIMWLLALGVALLAVASGCASAPAATGRGADARVREEGWTPAHEQISRRIPEYWRIRMMMAM